MKVEIESEILSSDGHSLEKGDRVNVSHDVGSKWCRHGWAKDMSGKVKTGARNINPVQIQPNKITNANKVTEA